jgi:hypothetical protein
MADKVQTQIMRCFIIMQGCLATVLVAFALLACSTPAAPHYQPKDADWPAIPAGQSVAERLRAADGQLLDYLKAMDNTQAYTAHQPTSADRELVAAWIAKLPAAQRQVLDERVVAIALVDHFMGNGMADWLRPAKNGAYPQRFILFVNADILDQTMSQRMSARDRSAFRDGGAPGPAGGERLVVRATLADGSEPPAIWYLLMHETAHIFDYARHATPAVEPWLPPDGGATGKPGDRPLTADVWKDYATPLPGCDFALRGRLAFFGLKETGVALANASTVYDQLCASPFPSLYASQNWAEYWAELATWLQFSRAGGTLTVELRDAAGKPAGTWHPLENPRVQSAFKLIGELKLGGL